MRINHTAIPEMHDCDIIQPETFRKHQEKAGGGVSKVAMPPERGWVYMGLAATVAYTKCPGAHHRAKNQTSREGHSSKMIMTVTFFPHEAVSWVPINRVRRQ